MSDFNQKEYETYFEQVLSDYHPAIARVVSSYEVIKSLQEELYQEISVAIWKSLSKFDNQSSLKTYILSIAHKRSISHVAKYAREPRKVDIENIEFSTESCPSVSVSNTQKQNKLILAIRQLPMLERQLVALSLEGVSYADIAEILGITTNLVGVKLLRAKAKLKTLINSGESK